MSTRRLSISTLLSIGILLGVVIAAPIQINQETDVVVIGQCAAPQTIAAAPAVTVSMTSQALQSSTVLPQASSPVMVSSSTIPVQYSATIPTANVVSSIPQQYSASVPVTISVSDVPPQSTNTPSNTVKDPIVAPVVSPIVAPVVGSGTTGQAIIKNTCSFDVQLQSVAGTEAGPVVSLAVGGTYSENYHNSPDGSGVAIKCIKNGEDWSTPMLLEYSPNLDMGLIFYDMSVSVGGNMQGHGGIGDTYVLTPSTIDQGSACVPVTYAESYVHLGEDDYATKSCSISTTITLNLC